MNRMMNEQQAWELDERPDEVEEPTVQAIADVEELANVILGEALPQEPALDSVQHYLQEIGRVSLLSASEEVELAERMERGGERMVEHLAALAHTGAATPSTAHLVASV